MTGLRNAGVLGASVVTVGLAMLYPTSSHSTAMHRRPGTALAPAGVVPGPSTGPAPATGPALSAAPPARAGSAKAIPTVVVNGSSVDTQYGPVQVQLTVRAGKVVKAVAIDYPQSGGRDQEINSYAVPILQKETVAAQSAKVDTVSGATFTSAGYQTSLQAALDAAHLG